MPDVLNFILGLVSLIVVGWFAWQSALLVDHKKRLKKNTVDKHTRASMTGKLIQCPFCLKETRVYHFAWTSILCEHCERPVKKFLWRY